jgi:ABC-2 type transport system ATP-binding protein
LEPAIVTYNLKKTFEDITAVDGISFEVKRNEIFGIVGPDGAGKTTTIRILCGLLRPDSGSANILGYDLDRQKSKIKKEIGYLSQKFSLYQDLTVDENIEFFADIHGVRKYKERREELLQFTRLKAFRKFLAGKLSGGMKQKLALACTLIHKPQIIFLDEPTTGVDPVSRRDFWKILSALVHEGITILITTPYLDEAERFSRIAMFSNGKILEYDTPANIKAGMHKQVIEIIAPSMRKTYDLLKSNSNYEVQIFGDRIDIVVDDYEKDFTVVKNLLEKKGIEITDHRLKPVSLENVFINVLEKRKLIFN